ncbi:hypothetical protein [Rhizohabitans arisaemae]|uniref:hypothetical protein n=1 Tax=Rhizohabitans arisaemae TaxID=2720610 RepID=UPI0024B26295|nr:hypothetical protein [Rhizohabitans arisaemae]
MQIIITLLLAVVALLGLDRFMLWLERRGHVSWRRTEREDITAAPRVDLDSLLSGRGGPGGGQAS